MRVPDVFRKPALYLFIGLLVLSYAVGRLIAPTPVLETVALDVKTNESSQLFYMERGKPISIQNLVSWEDAYLNPANADLRDEINQQRVSSGQAQISQEIVIQTTQSADGPVTEYKKLSQKRHFGIFSLLPALVAIILCWTTREPITALFGGVLSGALILTQFDIPTEIFIRNMADKDTAKIVFLYLWLLGGLLGIWSRTGAAQAFADFISRRFVKGPKSAKVASWLLGVVFFQGGTISTVLVGTSVKPLSDKQGVSHEELAYVVDSTASPIASQIPFNAWPGYVSLYIFVAGVPFLATEADRIAFFFRSVPFCFYAILAVFFTFLFSIEKMPWVNKRMRAAIDRSRKTGELDAPDAEPMAAKELETMDIPEGYNPSMWEFILPLVLLIGTAIGTFIAGGSPKIVWAFSVAIMFAACSALLRGMKLKQLIDGIGNGVKGVVMGSVVLVLAMIVGRLTRDIGAGNYMVEVIRSASIPYWALPVILQLLTILIAFSTGTSWGTYAVAFPMAMPVAWEISQGAGLQNEFLYMTLCFAAVMDGSVFGDQCSPISDTTVLSSMCTGCDLMDHVRTQLPQACIAAVGAGILWTLCAVFFV